MSKNKNWTRDDVANWMYEAKRQYLIECGCEDAGNPSLYDDDYGMSPTAEMPADGQIWQPEEFYRHFDIDQDGVVSQGDYADHVAYHNQHPDLLAPYERVKTMNAAAARCPDTYSRAGDVLIQIPEDVVQMLKPLMQKLGVGCPASMAQAMTDVLELAMEHDVVMPFSTEVK